MRNIGRVSPRLLCRAAVAVLASVVAAGCDSNPGGPTVSGSPDGSSAPAEIINKPGQTPAALEKGRTVTRGGATVIKKSAIKNAAGAQTNGSL